MSNKELIDLEFIELLQVGCRMAKMDVSPAGLVALLQIIDLVNEKGNQASIRDIAKIEVETLDIIEGFKNETEEQT